MPDPQGLSSTSRPRLLFFFALHDGRSRRVEGYLAQVLQRRHNHNTFAVHRIEMAERPDLVAQFRIVATPTLVVVTGKHVRGRLEQPRNVLEIESLLSPWLH